MYIFKQVLCRWLLLLGGGLFWVLGPGMGAEAIARTPPERTFAGDSGADEMLSRSAKKWVSEHQKVPAESLEMAPLDPRVKLQSCAVPLVFDTPFSSAESVRVRCAQPVWQLYVKVTHKQAQPLQNPSARVLPAVKEAPRKVLVAAGVLPRGTVLNETHVVLADADTSTVGSPAFEAVADVMYSELVRDVRSGQPIRVQDVRPTMLVKRGQTVLLSVGQSRGFQITARVEALQDGRMGEKVQLKNNESGKILTGVVSGPNAVQGY